MAQNNEVFNSQGKKDERKKEGAKHMTCIASHCGDPMAFQLQTHAPTSSSYSMNRFF